MVQGRRDGEREPTSVTYWPLQAGDHERQLAAARSQTFSTPTALWAADGNGTDAMGVRQGQTVDAEIGAVPRGGTPRVRRRRIRLRCLDRPRDADRVIVFSSVGTPTRYLISCGKLPATEHVRRSRVSRAGHGRAVRPGHTGLPPLLVSGGSGNCSLTCPPTKSG